MKLRFRQSSRIFLRITAGLCILIAILIVAAALAGRTDWFKNKVRSNTVTAIEHSTGARVQLGSFDFNWRTLTAKLSQLTLHGTEPAGGPPLFHADSVLLSLRIVSLLEKSIDISSVIVSRSETYLLVRPDGSTNIPGPIRRPGAVREIASDLLNLKIGHFEFRNAAVRTDLTRILFNGRGEGLLFVLSYKNRPSRYDIALSSRQLSVDSPQLSTLSGTLQARAVLKRDEITLENAALESGQSIVRLNGRIGRLADPVIDVAVTSSLRAEDIARRLNLSGWLRGQVRLRGTVHYERSAPAMFTASVEGAGIACHSPGLYLNNASLHFNAEGTHDKLSLSRISVADSGAAMSGTAVLTSLSAFVFDGRIVRLDLRRGLSELRISDVPYSGTLSGPVRLTGKLRKGLRDVDVQTDLRISPGTEGIPVSGSLVLSYNQPSQALEFGDSQIDSAKTHVALSGSPGNTLRLRLNTAKTSELRPVLEALALKMPSKFDAGLSQASIRFDGQLTGALGNPQIDGDFSVAQFQINGELWDELHSQISASSGHVAFTSLSASRRSLRLTAAGSVGLNDWAVGQDSPLRLTAAFKDADLNPAPAVHATASGSMSLDGTFSAPRGKGQFSVTDASVYGERLNQVTFGASLDAGTLTVTDGHLHSGAAAIAFSGTYTHQRGDWTRGQIQTRIDSNGFPLTSVSFAKKFLPALDARSEIHSNLRIRVEGSRLRPEDADGTLTLKRITLDGAPFGDLTVNAATRANQLNIGVAGNLEGSPISGNLRAHSADLESATGQLNFGRIGLSTIYDLTRVDTESLTLPDGFLQGGISFDGPLLRPDQIDLRLRIDNLQVDAPASHDAPPDALSTELAVHNIGPVLIEGRGGIAAIRQLQLGARDTHLTIGGSLGYGARREMNLQIEGSSDFRVFQIFDPNIQSAGLSVLQVAVRGTYDHPSIDGTMELRGGSLFVKNVTNGLSNVNGIVRFNRDRATIQTLTAQSGGGELRLTGFVSFANGPVIYNVQANATNVRFRYSGASVSANGLLQLTGSSENGLLSGQVAISRVIVNQNSDLGSILASTVTAAPPPENEKDLISGLLLDVRVRNSPNLRISTELSQDVEADIDLHVRGSAAHPILLGGISANQGEIKVFGAKYTINRGDITFLNSVRIEPVLDLDLQTETRGITVDITISGTLNKLNMNYRSDPPLQPKDIIALLTVGQAPSVTANPSNIKANSDVSALQAGANTVLGQAISPASNRISKLFGITNIKIDPLVQGITNTPQARLTLEQQISRDITVTYVTNLAQTSEQIFRFEWALNRQFSVVAVRDDNGEFGIDFQYKKRFR